MVVTSVSAYWEASTKMEEEDVRAGGKFLGHRLGEGSPVW